MKMLDMIWIMVSGLFCGIVFFWQASLIHYINAMEEEDACEKCDRKKRCLAWRKIRNSNWMTEFTSLTYVAIHKYCRYTKCQYSSTCRYMVISALINGILYCGLYYKYSLGVEFFLMALCTTDLIYVGIVDWRTQYIPVEFNVFILILGLIRLILQPEYWLERLIGLCSISVVLLMVDWVGGKLLHSDHVIGGGDIKLMAAAGLFLGWKLNIVAFVVGCICGSVIHPIIMKIGKGERQLAFGPYLAMGIYIAMICGEQLMSWYLGIMGL